MDEISYERKALLVAFRAGLMADIEHLMAVLDVPHPDPDHYHFTEQLFERRMRQLQTLEQAILSAACPGTRVEATQ